MMIKAIHNFVDLIRREEIEIYNEFSLQHELGIVLRSRMPDHKIRFERNVASIFPKADFVKREIDISVFSPDKSRLRYAVELKFPRNGMYPEQMYSFCKDILFAEQLKEAGFEKAFLVVFADDPLFYSGNGDGIYGYFRTGKTLREAITKPTGSKDETVKLKGSYQIHWTEVRGKLQYAVVEANSSM